MATRIESDSMGEIDVPAERYWGAQTERSRRHFVIGTDVMPMAIVYALARIKQAAAYANAELGRLDAERRDHIVSAAEEVATGGLDAHFPLVIFQTGSGTQTNMNVNEVVANRANEIAGSPLGSMTPVHPNDHVNLSQSSNDAFPSAMHVAILEAVHGRLVPSLDALRATLAQKSEAYADVVKLGRTHLQDATPLTLGQEISGWVAQLDHARAAILRNLEPMHELALGGTAVGTGLNTHPRYAGLVASHLARITGRPLVSGANKFALIAAHDAVVALAGAFAQLAAASMKIANDVRWLASGPRAGIGELHIPENEPGSSMMPGKVNPTQCEALTMVAVDVMGSTHAITVAASQGSFELNTFKPLLAHHALRAAHLLGDALASFDKFCAQGIEPDHAVITRHVDTSLMLVTALAPQLGYKAAAHIAQHAHQHGTSLRDAALALGLTTGAEFDRLVSPSRMTGPSDP